MQIELELLIGLGEPLTGSRFTARGDHSMPRPCGHVRSDLWTRYPLRISVLVYHRVANTTEDGPYVGHEAVRCPETCDLACSVRDGKESRIACNYVSAYRTCAEFQISDPPTTYASERTFTFGADSDIVRGMSNYQGPERDPEQDQSRQAR